MSSKFEGLLNELPRRRQIPCRIVSEWSKEIQRHSVSMAAEPKEPKSATLGKLKRIEDAITGLGPTARRVLDTSAPQRGQDIYVLEFTEITYDALFRSLRREELSDVDRSKLNRLDAAFATRGVWAGTVLHNAYEAQLQWIDETRTPFCVRLIGAVWLATSWVRKGVRRGRPQAPDLSANLSDRLARAYLCITGEHPPTTDPYEATRRLREHPYHRLVRETFKHAGLLPGWQHHARQAARRMKGKICSDSDGIDFQDHACRKS